MDVSKKTRPPGISMVRSHALRAAATGMRVAPLREVPGVPPEQPSDDGALVRSPRNELHALDVESLSPVRLVFENRLEHRFGLGRRVEELKT